MQNWMIALTGAFAEKGIELTKRELYESTPLYVAAESNPKRKGTMAHTRFNNYFNDGIVSIGDAFAAGLRQDDIRHDAEHGFILLGDDANKAFEASEWVEPVALLTYNPIVPTIPMVN